MKDNFDESVHYCMAEAAKYLFKTLQGCVLAYSQSDEISLLLVDYKSFVSQPAFGGCQNKIETIAASTATGAFNNANWNLEPAINTHHDFAMFDARAYTVPREDVTNYFVWRQQDAERNSVNALGQMHMSHKEMNNLSVAKVRGELESRGVVWGKLDTWKKRGFCVRKDAEGGIVIDREIPIFTQDRDYIEKLVYPSAE